LLTGFAQSFVGVTVNNQSQSDNVQRIESDGIYSMFQHQVASPNFTTIPTNIGFDRPKGFGYLSLVVHYASQKDASVLAYLQGLQEFIAGRVSSLGYDILESPWSEEGLYLYPPHSLHCVILYEKKIPPSSFADVKAMDVSYHPWLGADVSQVLPFTIFPRWFFTFGGSQVDATPTVAFSLQIYMQSEVVNLLRREFAGVPKVYLTNSPGYIRGATNLARFMSDKQCPAKVRNFSGIKELFRDLDKTFSVPVSFTVDCLSFVKSDCWLANPNPKIQDYRLGR
jgi:hypothetical protein